MKRMATLVLLLLTSVSWAPSASLYDQSIAEVLRQQFISPGVSYLLINVDTGSVVVARWDDRNRPVPVGSLLKPYTALAYGISHGYQYPEAICRGTADGCWLTRGHGRIGMPQAIGFSCNAYFRRLAERISREDIEQVANHYGLRGQFASIAAPDLVGLGEKMEVPPEQITRAYIELASHAGAPGVAELLQGMRLSARAGTANGIQKSFPGVSALAKTGTAPCLHTPHAPGDGFTIILYPADSPRWALLVRVHGVPGAHAAVVAGTMLRSIVTGR